MSSGIVSLKDDSVFCMTLEKQFRNFFFCFCKNCPQNFFLSISLEKLLGNHFLLGFSVEITREKFFFSFFLPKETFLSFFFFFLPFFVLDFNCFSIFDRKVHPNSKTRYSCNHCQILCLETPNQFLPSLIRIVFLFLPVKKRLLTFIPTQNRQFYSINRRALMNTTRISFVIRS